MVWFIGCVFSPTLATSSMFFFSKLSPRWALGPAGRDGPPEQRGPAGQRRGRLRQWPGPDPENEGEKVPVLVHVTPGKA